MEQSKSGYLSFSISSLSLLAAAGVVAACAVWPNKVAAQTDDVVTGEALVTQGGVSNSAVITQENPSEGMYAHIIQSGTGQDASIYQSGPVEDFLTAEIEQAGASNTAATEQTGVVYEGALSIYQNGNSNLATAIQFGSFTTGGSISQVGDLNQVTLYQADTNSFASISQEGTANTVNMTQSGIEIYSQQATVKQIGSNNVMDVTQDLMGQNQLNATQIGNGNYADLHQLQYPDISYGVANIQMVVDGNNNSVFVTQDFNPIGDFILDLQGDENRIEVLHGGEAANVEITSHYSNYNSDLIDQSGSAAMININRLYTNNSSTDIVQRSYSETIGITQEYTDNASVYIRQLSTLLSEIEVQQLNASGVNASINQNTVVSEATIVQNIATASDAIISQDYAAGTGGGLIASIYQTDGADMATAEILQTNVENIASIGQSGVTNTEARIEQTGAGGYALIVQTSLEGGVSNSASIIQAGEGYSASIYQDGNNNVATIAQM